eukprot:TRINITY_DN6912_c0_g2_i1.p1 TRINITY_DN6912_c0_g2~~TRINITY_DN6912_c0_g2_i1.p1  ORF type:complete len:338 (-),score=93.88 TRINITY_DN6912_c0_g2_i1:247-1224(-)
MTESEVTTIPNTGRFKGYTVFITGASRGIGLAIATKLARDGANIAIAAKTSVPHPKLPGTIFSAAAEIEKVGGKALPIICDVRSEESVKSAIARTVHEFGGIDILINNASAIWLKGIMDTNIKRYDLINQINARGTYLCSHLCLPYLLESAGKGRNPHVLNLSPPLNTNPHWFKTNTAYTISKYGMSMVAVGLAAEFEEISVNCLWPKTAIATAAIENNLGSETMKDCRRVEIMSDAAYVILSTGSGGGVGGGKRVTGRFLIDEHVLRGVGVGDFSRYRVDEGKKNDDELAPDFFLDEADLGGSVVSNQDWVVEQLTRSTRPAKL